MGLTATLTHMLLWNFDDIKSGWEWAAPSRLKKWLKPESYRFWENVETPEARLARIQGDETLDPHYRLMVSNLYHDTAQWWWGAVLLTCFITSLACLYEMKSTLPWWGFIVSVILVFLFMLFFGAQYGLTGFQFNVQPICQMLAGYMFPGRPLASEYESYLSWKFKCLNIDRHVLYLFHLQRPPTRPGARKRSPSCAEYSSFAPMHVLRSGHRVSCWRSVQLCHDANVRPISLVPFFCFINYLLTNILNQHRSRSSSDSHLHRRHQHLERRINPIPQLARRRLEHRRRHVLRRRTLRMGHTLFPAGLRRTHPAMARKPVLAQQDIPVHQHVDYPVVHGLAGDRHQRFDFVLFHSRVCGAVVAEEVSSAPV